MKKHAVSYAIIRFQPHVETEEFANIGIVLVAPRMGFLDFKLETRRLARLTNFFDSIEAATVRAILRNYYVELKRIRDLAGHNGNGQTRFEFDVTDNAEHLFSTLTKDREGIIQFSDIRFAMTDSPRVKLGELFDYYVRRNFASSVYREGLLEKEVRATLKMQELGRIFKPMAFTDGIYSAKFPFVEIQGNEALTILKPLYLGQDEPTRILDHGNKWLFTINRLRETLPNKVVFAVEGPDDKAKRRQAFQETIDLFKKNAIKVVDAKNKEQLLDAIES